MPSKEAMEAAYKLKNAGLLSIYQAMPQSSQDINNVATIIDAAIADARREQREAEENDREAHTLLNLINAEFQSDPMSVQCFDLRIVERVRNCVEKQRAAIREEGEL